MEANLPVVARRIWSMIRVVFFMMRKGISKRKLMVDLNMIMKRGKIAGKAAIYNLMFHHHHHHWSTANRRSHDGHLSTTLPGEYEFSCSNSPAFPFPFSKKHYNNNNNNNYSHFFSCVHAPPTEDDHEMVTVNAVKKVLEMLNSEAASPALPGFGRTPMARQLRVTDSPFPLQDIHEDSHVVDEAAEEFIVKFYNDLRQQNKRAESEGLFSGYINNALPRRRS
uniref:Avr9/Cf-9 rapidly elicited protein 146 n=1 Tax=Davidia involucrata TaxID=16924 RepID=A0A5B7BNZ0_DAVIN